jgi:hypothetical protein
MCPSYDMNTRYDRILCRSTWSRVDHGITRHCTVMYSKDTEPPSKILVPCLSHVAAALVPCASSQAAV